MWRKRDQRGFALEMCRPGLGLAGPVSLSHEKRHMQGGLTLSAAPPITHIAQPCGVEPYAREVDISESPVSHYELKRYTYQFARCLASKLLASSLAPFRC